MQTMKRKYIYLLGLGFGGNLGWWQWDWSHAQRGVEKGALIWDNPAYKRNQFNSFEILSEVEREV